MITTRLRIGAACLGLLAMLAHGQDFPVAGDATVEPEVQDQAPADSGSALVAPLAMLDSHVLPGSQARLLWRAGQSYSGTDMDSPVLVARGARPGPALCLVAGVHGDEINGVETVRRVMSQIRPELLVGTLIGVPVVNLYGYQRSSRYLPDRRDLNRFFPGSRNGSIASRIAYSFFESVVRHCNAIVDFHTGSFDRSNLPQVRADLTRPRVLQMARGFGATVVLHSKGSRGMLRLAATEAGIPAVTFEAGAPARLQEDEIGTVVAAIERLMHHLGMIETEPYRAGSLAGHWLDDTQPVFYASRWIRAEHGGLLISDAGLGEMIEVGQRLGRIIDPLSNQVREIRAPLAGRMLGMAENQQVLPGFALFHIGLETSEREVVTATVAEELDPVAEDEPGERPRGPEEDPEPGED